MDEQILEILKRIEQGQIKTNERLDKIENKIDKLDKTLEVVYDQTANLSEFKTDVLSRLAELKEVEEVTKVNCYDIAKLKAIK
ncbi:MULTISPECIES: hypothetical protein [Clostridium]|uniref:Uncharacterized protein n=3 Tax=Clostridium TaxID=1485 RepID=A0A381JA95_9CLOT|nr:MULTISPECIES: hypothetical protein [Clostridium]MBU3194914.1 hypothetical protein [Clostridium algidicarnis]MBU3209048.1 hypothetical protein [Clostridium algidicarnis]MBU3221129.1 hypothetical protein [Clostridium algidicarnis]MBU3228770.1 hypothetical protein [Clostridium algidicarnis]MBU3252314.1 hypothetical protein [Clostridium algidicarnis]